MYTDGLCDTVNPQGELFGTDRIRAVFRQAAPSPRGVINSLQAEATTFRGTAKRADDTCIICLGRMSNPST